MISISSAGRFSSIQRVRVLWAVGWLLPSELPRVAAELLAEFDANELVQLAVADPGNDHDRLISLFENFLAHQNLEPISAELALMSFVIIVSCDICDGRIDALAGARAIWDRRLALRHSGHEYDPFIYALSEHDERPEDRAMFIAAIVDEARRWCLGGRGSVDVWNADR